MKDIKNIDSIPDPRKKIGDKDTVDPEKFEKALKIEKSEETDKREKRNRPKKQEEGDEETDVSAAIPVPQGLFKEYMSEDEKTSSIFDSEGGKKAHLVSDADDTTSSKKMYIPDDEEGVKSNISVENAAKPSDGSALDDNEDSYISFGEEATTKPPSDEGDQNLTTAPPSDEGDQNLTIAPPSDEGDQNLNIPPSEESIADTSFENSSDTKSMDTTDQQKPVDKSSSKNKTNKKEDTTTKKDKTRKKEDTTTKQAGKKKTSEKATTNKEKTPTTQEPIGEKSQIQKKLKKDTLQEEDKTTNNKKDTLVNQTEGLSDQQKEKEQGGKSSDKEQKDDEEIAPVSIPLASPTGVATIELSPFSNMPNDVFELFEKMVGMMTVQKESGKSTTTVTLNMPSSIFNKCELVLEHYDTAPHAYNVQFLGNPEAVERFTKSMQGLNNVITESKLSFSIHLLPPKLSKAFSGRVERKDSDKGEGGSSGGGEKGKKEK